MDPISLGSTIAAAMELYERDYVKFREVRWKMSENIRKIISFAKLGYQ